MDRTWHQVDLGVRSTYRGMDTPGNRRSNGAMPIRRATVELWDIHDRMPVILHPDEHETWLLAPSDEAMRRYPAEQLVIDPRAQPIDHKALSRKKLFEAAKTGIPAASIARGQDPADFIKVDPDRARRRQISDTPSQSPPQAKT